MSYQIVANFSGEVGVNPRLVRILSTDSLATCMTAGYLSPNNPQVAQILPSDFIFLSYNVGLSTQANQLLVPSISTAGVITLNAYIGAGNITTPVTSGDIPKFSGTTGLMIDSGIAAANLQLSALSNPDTISDLIWYDVTATAAALATAGKVNVQVSSGSKQYKVRNLLVNYAAAGLSGGGGDRLLALTDGTTVYNNAGITAALLGTPVNTVWGGSGNPLAGTVAMNTSTAAGANLYLQYSGGTTDYTTGQIVVSVLVQRVA